MKQQLSISKALFAGISATVIMTLFTYMGQIMDIKMNIPEMLSSMFGGNLIIGWFMHFMIGILLAFGYAILFYRKINIKPVWLKGAVFGIIPWLMAQVIVMPMMSIMNGMTYSAGFFSGSLMMAMASLVGHLIFGTVIGVLYKPKTQLATV